MPPAMAPIVTLYGSNYHRLKQIFMVPKGFEPSQFDCMLWDAKTLFMRIFFLLKNEWLNE